MRFVANPPSSSHPLTLHTQSARPRPQTVPVLLLGLAIIAYALLFGWLSLERYWAYQMHALDMGNMGQAAWNTVHGHPFWFTNMRLPYAIEAWNTTTRLSFHVEALFPILALVYLVYPHPESLLVLQTAAIALGALPVYLLARDLLGSAWLGLTFALAYLLSPALQAMNLYEFHPVSLATPLLLCAFLFACRRAYALFVVACLAAMGTKEEIGLVVALFGLYVALVNRKRRVGLTMVAVGTAWSLFAALVIEHHFRQPGTLTYLHTRYGYLCGSADTQGHLHCGIRPALRTLLHDPGTLSRVLVSWPKLGYLQDLLAPLGYMPILAPAVLLLGIPTWALNLFSQDPHMYSGLGDNSAELIAVTVIAAILGARLVVRLLGPWMTRDRTLALLGAWLLIAALWSQRQQGFTPLGPRFQTPAPGAHQAIENRFVSLVPEGVPVATQDQIDPHLSSRRYLYLFPDTGRQPPLAAANVALLDVSAPTYPLPSFQLYGAAMHLLHGGGWGVAAADDGLIMLSKGSGQRSIPGRFYRYALARKAPTHRMRVQRNNLVLLGYDVEHTDLANHRVPNLAYTFYLRTRRPGHNIQPVVYEEQGGRMIGCVHEPLGLAWLPTSHWRTGKTYLVRMDPLESDSGSPGVASLWVELRPVPHTLPSGFHPDCAALWRGHSHLYHVGSLSISF